MDKLFLLDAYALIYRAYYALIKSPRINSKGFNTSAILGFVNTLEDVLKKEAPTHIDDICNKNRQLLSKVTAKGILRKSTNQTNCRTIQFRKNY